jgi:hypothetical protein
MIIRVFRARIRAGKQAEFKRLVQTQSIPWLEPQPGLVAYYAGEPLGEDAREFVMVTLWQDLASLRAFVGDDWEAPVVTEDEQPLVESMVADHYLGLDKP